ncbi:MAG: VWA domain-containing protein [Proteobacteria bacterium]|nr:VWA domain-containing protein [Pseudomonadota bacterium]
MAVSNDTENTGTNSEVSAEVIVEVLPGALVRVPFESPQGVRFTQDAGNLLVTPTGGGEAILLQDFLTFGTTENPPKIEFADGQILEINQVTSLVENYSETDVSPASGDDFSAGGGANFSEYVDQGIGDPIGIADLLPPTDLAFGDDVLEEIIGENENFDGLPNDDPDGTVVISFSTPGSFGGSVSGGYEDWQPSQNFGDFTEFPMQVVVEFTPDSDEQLQTIDLSGFPSGARFFVGGTDAGDEVDVSGGSVSVAAVGGVLPAMYLLPPANSDADIPLEVSANFINGDGFTGSTEASGTAIIDAVADIPELAGSDATGDEDTAIDIPITAALEDTDGSESLAVSISGVPVGATLSDGVNTFVGDGSDVDVTGWDLGSLQITPPADDDSDFSLAVTAVSTEAATVAGGGELTDSNNTATASITIDVTVDPVSDIPTVVVSDAAGKEDLGNAGDQIAAVPAPASGDIPLNITLTTGEGGTEDGYVVLSGYPAGVTFTVGAADAGGWRVEQADLAALAINGLPEDSDADFAITVTPYSVDGTADPVAGTPGVLNVVIDAVADIPTLTLDGSAADATASGEEDTAIDLPDIVAGLQDTDGSETATVSISGVPIGATLSDGNGNDFIGDGSDVDITGWDLTALTITSAADDDTDFTLTVSVTSTEAATVAGGGEINEADNSATVSYDIDVTVTDEGPVAVADNPPSLNELPNTHAIFVIDTSGSLSAAELAQMEAALKNLATSMFEANPDGTVITLIDFGTDAEFIGGGDGTYDTLESVLSALDPLNTLSGGLTNYQSALDLARTVDFEPGFEKAIYFISDGDPNRGDTAAGISDFNDWVENDLGGADLYAVGITDVGETSPWLGSLDNTPDDNNVNPVGGPYLYVEDPSDLSASLVTSNTSLSDNVLTNDVAGNDALADVPIVSVAHNGTTYDLTSVGPNVSVDGNILTLDTDLGRLVLNFENGDYTYSVTSDVNNVETDVFNYTIIDTDGLTSSADLTIQINPDSSFVGSDAAEDIVGGMTNDYIAGMGGDDTLNGGDGDDRFAFLNAATDGNDVIEDFGIGNDVIDLTAVFDELGIDPGDRADHVLFDESGGNTTITVTDASDVEVGGFSIVVENTSLNNGDIGSAIQVDES